jgi:hypothetical protein
VLLDKCLHFVYTFSSFYALVPSLFFILVEVHELVVVVALGFKLSFNSSIVLMFVNAILTAVVA